MEMGNTRERVLSLKKRIESGEELPKSVLELEGILSADCAELDKAKVA